MKELCCTGVPLLSPALRAFFKDWTNLSGNPLDARWYGAQRLCFTLFSFTNWANSADTNWGPLSLTSCHGRPYAAKTLVSSVKDLGRCGGSHLNNLWPLGVGIYYYHKHGTLKGGLQSRHGCGPMAFQAKPRDAMKWLLVHSWWLDMPYSSWPFPQCLSLTQATICGFWQVTLCQQPQGVLGVVPPGHVSSRWPAIQSWFPSWCSLPPRSVHSHVVQRLEALLALPQQANLFAYTTAPDPGLGLDG